MTEHTPILVLNIVPLTFSQQQFAIGRVAFTGADDYRALREKYWRTHAFRFDQRSGDILNVAIGRSAEPLGSVEEVDIASYLLLAAAAVQQAILIWLADSVPILKKTNKQLLFWGQAEGSLLLSKSLAVLGLDSIPGLEVPIRYEIDCRRFFDADDNPFLGLLIDVSTTNVIDIPVSELIAHGLSAEGRYVCRRRAAEETYLYPRLDLLGRVCRVDGSRLSLTDSLDGNDFETAEVLLEPRLENLQATIEAFWGQRASAVFSELQSRRMPIASAAGKLTRIKETLAKLRNRKQPLTIANGVQVLFGEVLDDSAPQFPDQIATQRPTVLFGAQGRNVGQYPDMGIRSWGPYMYMQHTRNTPIIAVVCEARHRGTVEQFANALCEGFPDEAWKGKGDNPYRGGLVGKFRLGRVRLEYEECDDTTPATYRAAARRLLSRLAEMPDLALVQTREAFRQAHGDENSYFVAKAAFMAAGVPVQAVQIEKMMYNDYQLPYLLNNVALATYAKLDGTPWVISTKGTTTHELIVGLGSKEISTGRLSTRERYVGITTVFQGDGRYLLWNQTREVTFEDYPAELLASLRTAIRYIEQQQRWEVGDRVRLVCHVYKRLKNAEVDAIKALVAELLNDRFSVEFAFLDVSLFHPYRLFAPKQQGIPYWRDRKQRFKGKGIPNRGICLQLDRHRALLHLTGPSDVKTDEQGLPQPLLLELHPDSDFTDLAYLAREVYHFTYASWRSFMPATEPVTIKYSELIAGLLGNLKTVAGWDSTVLTMGGLRGRCWFL